MNGGAMMRGARRLAALGALVLGPAVAAQGKPETPPPPGTPKGFQLPARHEFTLPNGMGVTLVPYGAIPKVDVQLRLRVGNVDETADQVWLGDVMGDLMEEGTTTRSAQQLASEAADMGGSLDVSVGSTETTVGGSVLAEFAPRMVALVADVAMHPGFPDSELARVKADRERDLAIQQSQPQSLAFATFRRVMYPGHPYGRVFPTAAMLKDYTTSQVRAFYGANVDASRAHLYVVGRFDPVAVEQAVRRAFAGWRRGSPAAPVVPHPVTGRAVHLLDRPGAVQSSLILGLPVANPVSPDWIPLQVTNALLGGAFDSRITVNIRERKGYTYSPYSEVSTRYRDAYWAEIADVTTNVTGPALEQIFYEIDRLRKEPPSADELQGIENYLAGTFVLRNASRGGIINQLDFVRLHGLPDSYLTTYVQKVDAVTPAGVRRIADRYLDPSRMAIVVVGDRKLIETQLRPFGKIVE